MGGLVHFSSRSGNTGRFVAAVGVPSDRIPIAADDDLPMPAAPYVLICPTFADGEGRGAVPKQVIRFLNDPERRALIRGVIAAGNTNFGEAYCIAGDIISAKCKVPHMYKFELLGTARDVQKVHDGLEEFWRH